MGVHLESGDQLNVQTKVQGRKTFLFLFFKNKLPKKLDKILRRVCTLCEFNTKKTMFSLRGLCSESRHDRRFILEANELKKPFFKGLSTSIIVWVSSKISYFKHEYLRSRASRCLSLWSSSSSDSHLSVKSLRFFCILKFIEMLVLISWIPASENFTIGNSLFDYCLSRKSQFLIFYNLPTILTCNF